MIKILEKGYSKFKTWCDKCNCTFEYELTDVYYNKEKDIHYVNCPECNHENDHLAIVKRMRETDAILNSSITAIRLL